MPMRPQSKQSTTRSALRQALAILVLFFFVLGSASVSANVTLQTMPEHFTAQSASDNVSQDCAASEQGLGHPHCQTTTLGIAGRARTDLQFLPVLGSGVWFCAAVTCGPTPKSQRLLRPPKPVRAHV